MKRTADDYLAEKLFNDLLSEAIAELRARGTPVYTFAMYHDHESAAVSVCVDTASNSTRAVASQNAFRIKYFSAAIANDDLRDASSWNANIGRNLSLGDFELINLARTELETIKTGAGFYLNMVRTLRSRETEIVQMTNNPETLLFCCSSADSEVGYYWSPILPNALRS